MHPSLTHSDFLKQTKITRNTRKPHKVFKDTLSADDVTTVFNKQIIIIIVIIRAWLV